MITVTPGLALRRYTIGDGSERTEHVLVWADAVDAKSRTFSIGDINALLMARNADELIAASSRFGPIEPRYGDCQCEGELLEKPNCDLLLKESVMRPFVPRQPVKAATKRAMARYSMMPGMRLGADAVVEPFAKWVGLHDFLSILCSLIALSSGEMHPLTTVGFKGRDLKWTTERQVGKKLHGEMHSRHGWETRFSGSYGKASFISFLFTRPQPEALWRELSSEHLVCIYGGDKDGNFLWVGMDDSKNERRVADELISEFTSAMLSMRGQDGTLSLGPGDYTIQGIWYEILSKVTSAPGHRPTHKIIRCENCGRCRIASLHGKSPRWCSDSCRVTATHNRAC